jgi:hypothetical protein
MDREDAELEALLWFGDLLLADLFEPASDIEFAQPPYPGTDTVYPAESYGLSGPIASLRLKHWRRGIQDVDYLAMAHAVDPVATDAIVAATVPAFMWEMNSTGDETWSRGQISWSTDPDVWETARVQLAQIIEGHP